MPWTKAALNAAMDLAARLSQDERSELEEILPDLVRETPSTSVAVARFRLLVGRAGSAVSEGLKEILYGVLTEAVNRRLWGS